MEASTAVSEAILDFYRGVTNKEIARFDEIVSSDHATLVIGTAPGEWVTERPRLRFGFETEGLTLEPGRNPVGYQEGTMGWFTDEPWFGFPGGGGMRTRVTGIVRREADRWKVVHLHFSVGVPDEEVQALQARWGVR
ncbi:MAG TPA: nuclear transport factor 2 family protein [Candidatus Limnocylindrales bacterium]|nr:nuclear transport factor 2 family protein [Candidatus Limnocylindrales bacterium]